MGSEGVEDQRRHTVVTSHNGCLKAWSESRGTHGIAPNGEDWYRVRHGRLIITPDGTTKEEANPLDRSKRFTCHPLADLIIPTPT